MEDKHSLYNRSSFPDKPTDGCECDDNFVEWLKARNIQSKMILHCGTGNRHRVGLACEGTNNETIGLTISIVEYEDYYNLIRERRGLDKNYKCILTSMYALTDRCLPNIDLACLFHLGEYYHNEDQDSATHNDESLLSLVIRKLNDNGLIAIFNRSYGFKNITNLIRQLQRENILKYVDAFKSLSFYKVR